MPRMSRYFTLTPFVMLALILTTAGTGCGPSEKDLKIQDLTAENEQLKNELDERDRQLNDAIVRENDARETIDELNRELASMRAVASRPPIEQPRMEQPSQADGWIKAPSFDMISLPGSVLFASGKADITRKGRSALARIASDIRSQFSDRDIYVFGHTDNQPIRKSKWKDNWELGAARSLSVVRALRNNGISNEQLIQASCGPYRPKESNSSNRGRLQNRRVEFYAVKRNMGMIESTARGFSSE